MESTMEQDLQIHIVKLLNLFLISKKLLSGTIQNQIINFCTWYFNH